jgi:hypothetical protein
MGVGGQLYTSAAYPQRLFAVIMNSRVDLVSWASLSQVDTSPEIITCSAIFLVTSHLPWLDPQRAYSGLASDPRSQVAELLALISASREFGTAAFGTEAA